ncbi:indole-3-glycerol phosphate synthase [Stanieria cyanosphaera PCC 7437]|uniref:Indole-3-glycerol phosphate synthase n=1 Tax=Stanieria cyanosphaera (strain ATCC 29371 / PCC 7437) TaxID=111780 RepID=K9XXZ1_STAC7|nr:indole-3-glycerol phosphate synthase TrpC [Stanieria cyanosphaera]AFZ37398.1 indole-3-glycerol phosphate synthase [Stanieria cyanosphaera PCC 7437]
MQIRRINPNPQVNTGEVIYQANLPDAKPRHILEEIVWYKETEVAKMRDRLPLLELRQQVATVAPPNNFLAALKNGKTDPALIAEVKKASPSKGVIKEDFNPVAIAKAYQAGGASCLSVLTDEKFFQGSFDNLSLVRQEIDLPLLCKEFIIYPYQIYFARAKGADAVLLIAAILSNQDLKYFTKIIKALGMTALIEVHTLAELDRVLAIEEVDLIGINNRNLENFTVSLQTTNELLKSRKEVINSRNILIVSESGLHNSEDLNFVKEAGANAVLIGESLVKQSDPEQAIYELFGY